MTSRSLRSWIRAAPLASLAVIGCAAPNASHARDDLRTIVEKERGAHSEAEVDALLDSLAAKPMTVDVATTLALAFNSSFRAKLAELDLSSLDLQQAALFENPRLAASLRFPNGGGGTNSEFGVVWNVLDVFLRSSKKSFAAAQYSRTVSELAAAARELARDVQRDFFELQAAEQDAAELATIADAAHIALSLAEQQREAGTISEYELAFRRADDVQSKLDRMNADAEVITRRANLARSIGPAVSLDGWTVEPVLPKPPDVLPSAEIAHFLAWNPCWPVRAIQAEIEALEKARELSRQSLFGAIQVGIDTERDVDGTRVTGPTLEIGLPFFDRNQAARARIGAAIDSARDRQDALMHSVLIDVAESHAHWIAARREYQTIEDELIPERREVQRLSLERYNGMLLGVYDLLKARSQAVEAERAATRALRDFWIEHAELELLCGAKLDDPRVWEEVPRIERSNSADADADDAASGAASGEPSADWRTVRFDSVPSKSDAPPQSAEHEHHH